MKKLLLLFILIATMAMPSQAKRFADETVSYKVMYKWGLINKQAGTVSISLKNNGDKYYSTLTAKSASWADKFYMVRDTLKSVIVADGLKPVVYEKFAHEDRDYTRDRVTYRHAGATVYGDCSHVKYKSGKLYREKEVTLDAIGTTLDMLTAFYYMRQLPYATWTKGQVTTLNIFSGRKKELLTIKYNGTETVEYDGKKESCYHITFIFTTDGKKKSSDDMSAWISTKTGIPVKLEGKLPVGSVRCFYTGDK